MSEPSREIVWEPLKIVDPRAPVFVLSDEERSEIVHEISHYPDPRAASIEALKIVQKHRGWVSDDAIDAIARVLGIPGVELEGVATFYSLIFRRPIGRHVIKVCDSIACHLTGYEELRDALVARLGIHYGQTTRDGRFTLLPICCLGACDRGACVMIDDDLHGPVAPAEIAAVLEPYK
jgi:NADH-quinone oxidoreductase subunit E